VGNAVEENQACFITVGRYRDIYQRGPERSLRSLYNLDRKSCGLVLVVWL
jgi:hypothetical protein